VLPTHGAVWHVFSQADTKLLQSMLPYFVRQRERAHDATPQPNAVTPARAPTRSPNPPTRTHAQPARLSCSLGSPSSSLDGACACAARRR